MAQSPIGKVDPFDNTVDDWKTYVERIKQYFAANDVADGKRVSCLISLMGGRTYGLLRSLTAPLKPSEKSYEEIVEILRAHLSPKPLVIAERFRFHKRDQRDDETIGAFVADIRKLSHHCEFGETLDASLRDRLVCGLRNELIQKRLLSEADLTFTRAIAIAVAMETAAKDASELQHQRHQETEVHKIAANRPIRRTITPLCYRCNGNHNAVDCRFKEAICHNCSKRGHIRKACRQPPQRGSDCIDPGRKIKTVEREDEDDDFENSVSSIEILKNYSNSNDRIWVDVEINSRNLRMELDTGSGVSIISQHDYESKFHDIPLQSTGLTFKTYTGERIVPVGVIEVELNTTNNGMQ